MSEVIKLEDVWRIYDMGEVKVNALRGVNLKINKGEFVAIEGKSGSGKSTLVNAVGCLDFPSKGKIFLDKQDISKLSESALAQIRGRTIGFVFQQFNLINTLNAMENVMLPMMFQNTPSEQRKKRAQDLLQMVGLGDRMDHKPTQLSGGQQQRVAIARALANDPEVVLADEPTGNLDTKTGEMVMRFLMDLNKQGKTVIMVTHDSDLAKKAKRKIVLEDGLVVKGG